MVKMEDNLLHIPQMLLIGSSGRNSGKTTLAITLLQQWKKHFSVVGLKVTSIEERDGKCPRGGEGCGVCNSLNDNFEILEETNRSLNKDTSILLASGADRVYWLKTLKDNIGDGIRDLMTKITANSLIICESNSLRNVVRPGGFIMINNGEDDKIKESAKKVMHKADIIIDYDFKKDIDSIIEKIEISKVNSDLSIKIVNNS